MALRILQHHKGLLKRLRATAALLNIIPLFLQSACIPKLTEVTDTRAMIGIRMEIIALDTLHHEEVLQVTEITMTRQKDIDLDQRDQAPRHCDLHLQIIPRVALIAADGAIMVIQAVAAVLQAHMVHTGRRDLHPVNHVIPMLFRHYLRYHHQSSLKVFLATSMVE